LKNKNLKKNKWKLEGLFYKLFLPILFYLLIQIILFPISYAKETILLVELNFASAEEYKYLKSGLIKMIESKLAVPNMIVPKVGKAEHHTTMKATIDLELYHTKASYRIALFKEGKVLFSASEDVPPQEFMAKYSSALERARQVLIEVAEVQKRSLTSRLSEAFGKINPIPYISEIFFKNKDKLLVKVDIPPPPPPPTGSFSATQTFSSPKAQTQPHAQTQFQSQSPIYSQPNQSTPTQQNPNTNPLTLPPSSSDKSSWQWF